MSASGHERRKGERRRTSGSNPIVIRAADSAEIRAELTDSSDTGISVRCRQPVVEGSLVSVEGRPALVCWTIAMPDGTYRAGLSFNGRTAPAPAAGEPVADYYDILQLSPRADHDTIHRVFRILAQRYHPDNHETGNEEQFKQLLAAYQVLSDPEQRAAYDARRFSADPGRWRIFNSFEATRGVESEKRKRKGILSLLYARRVLQPEQPHMTLREMEELLGCPREHLEFSLWYLKENALVARTDNARYSITAKGVDHAERMPLARKPIRPLISAGGPGLAER